jgi:hypothetical protein
VQSFIGEATVQLQGLPPQVTCEPVTVTAETTEIQFQIVTNSESPLGNHKSLFCQIVLQVNGQVTTSVTGKTEFQINPPSAPVMAQPVVEVAQPERLRRHRYHAWSSCVELLKIADKTTQILVKDKTAMKHCRGILRILWFGFAVGHLFLIQNRTAVAKTKRRLQNKRRCLNPQTC